MPNISFNIFQEEKEKLVTNKKNLFEKVHGSAANGGSLLRFWINYNA